MTRQITTRARRLRQNETLAERLLWADVRSGRLNGIKVRRQHPVGGYVVDFACPFHRIAFEVDGGVHDVAEVAERDYAREQAIEACGWLVLRFANRQVIEDRPSVLAEIERAVLAAGGGDPHPPVRDANGPLPLPQGEG